MDRTRTAVRPLTDGSDQRTSVEVGRRARLELVFSVRRGRTVLAHTYAEPPLRVGRCFDDGDGVHLILASSAPGAFGGDHFDQRIIVEAGAKVRLTSQSALQLHPSPVGASARLSSRYEVAAGAELSCTWDPLIPFAGAALEQRIEIDVAEGGRLSWSDAMMSGREGSGERWQFARLSHELRVRIGSRLAYLERYCIEPDATRVTEPWIAGRSTYFGTMLRIGMGDTRTTAEAMHTQLESIESVRASADLLDGELLLTRIAAVSGVPFHRARLAATGLLAATSTGS